jgi:phosphoglycolate phosphatase
MLPIDLIIFDLDGTLLDTPPNIAWSVNAVLKSLGLPPKPASEIYRYIGIGIDKLISDSLGSKNQQFFEEAVNLFKEHQRHNYYKKVKVYPGVRKMLKFFKHKIKIVISNKNYFSTRLCLEHFGLASFFKRIYGGDAIHLRKPSNAKIKKILHDFHISPNRAIIIGDMTIDIETGQNSGIHTGAVTYGLGKLTELKKARPDFIIRKVSDLTKILS